MKHDLNLTQSNMNVRKIQQQQTTNKQNKT